MLGKLIIFEGVDSCGKSTQLDLAYTRLVELGYNVVKTKEPGGTLVGDKIREILLDPNNNIDKTTEAYLFAASRAAHNMQIVEWIKQGKIVLCDRHLLSSYVYQGKYLAEDINMAAMKILAGDNKYNLFIENNILLFNISYETYMKRLSKRMTERQLDRIENQLNEESIKQKLKDYNNHDKLFNPYKIDANSSIRYVHEITMHLLLYILNKK